MSIPSAMVQAARDRAHKLDDDARAAVRDLLDNFDGTADDDLARWARDHELAAHLRERWARDLVAAAADATAPVWAEVDACDNFGAEGAALWDHEERWAHGGIEVGLDDLDEAAADELRRIVAEAEAEASLPGTLEGVFIAICPDGRCWAVSMVLSSPVLRDDTRADVWAMLDADTARRVADEALVADVEASPNEWAPSVLEAAPWEWLGGWLDQPEPDEGPVREGFEVVSRFEVFNVIFGQEGQWRVLRPAGPPRYLRAFARDLWLDRWHDEADRTRRKPAAVLAPVHRGVGRFLGGLHTGRNDNPRQLALPGLVAVPTLSARALADALARAAEHGGGVLAHRIVRALLAWGAAVHAVGEGWRVEVSPGVEGQRTAGGAVDLWIEHGLDGLREAVGSRSKKDAPRYVLDALGNGTVAWASDTSLGRSALLPHWEAVPAAAGRPAVLRLTLGPLLLPGAANAPGVMPHDRVLVPVLPPPRLPSGPRMVAGALALDWALMGVLGDRRAELRERGSVELDPVAVGREAGVEARLAVECMALWLKPDERWTSPEPGRYRLADHGPEGAAHRLLIEGATRSEQARERVKRRRR